MTKKKSYAKQKKSYTIHISIFGGLTVVLTVFIFWLVANHLDMPDLVREQRNVLLKSRPGSSVAERIKPVGQVDIAKAEPSQTSAPASDSVAGRPPARRDGQHVYNEGCVACHGSGIAGAPKLGDKGQWAKRVAKGRKALYDSAIKGKQGAAGVMPPKGGNTSLSDADVKAAVDYIVSQSN
jgi:cytochrome c5